MFTETKSGLFAHRLLQIDVLASNMSEDMNHWKLKEKIYAHH